MSSGTAVGLIAGREIRERLQGRFLRVMTVLTALLVVAGVTLPALIHSGSRATAVGLVGSPAEALAAPLQRNARAAKLRIRVVNIADDRMARARLRAGTLDAALSLPGDKALLEVKQTLPTGIRPLVSATLQELHLRGALARAGVPRATVDAALAPVAVATVALSHPRPDQSARYLAAVAVGILMYLSLGIYGGAVAQGVAQEKTTRTAEVLLAAVRPRELMAGKVVGIGVCGLGQLAGAAAAGLIANAIVHSASVPASVWVLIPSFLLYFLAGFALYAFAFAAAGAMVARQEEVQFVTTPFSIVLLAGYLLVYAALGSPNAIWAAGALVRPPTDRDDHAGPDRARPCRRVGDRGPGDPDAGCDLRDGPAGGAHLCGRAGPGRGQAELALGGATRHAGREGVGPVRLSYGLR